MALRHPPKANLAALSIVLLLSGAGAFRPPPSFIEAAIAQTSREKQAVLDIGEPAQEVRKLRLTATPAQGGSLAQGLHSVNGSKHGLVPVKGIDEQSKIVSEASMSHTQLVLFWLLVSGIFAFALVTVTVVYSCVSSGSGDSDKEESKLTSSYGPSVVVDPTEEDFGENLTSYLHLSWFSINFKDKQHEQQWYSSGEGAKQTAYSARVLAFVCCGMAAYEIMQICLASVQKMGVSVTAHLVVFIVQVVLLMLLLLSIRNSSKYLYWPCLFAMHFLIPATALPPLTPSCKELAHLSESKDLCDSYWGSELMCLDEAVRHVDCSPQGHTAMQIVMTWILLQPWVLPGLVHMHMVWSWVFIVFPGWVKATSLMTGDTVFDSWDCAIRMGILSLTMLVAVFKKFALEKSRRIKFLQELQQKASSRKIFTILEDMMPVHVIGPMLTDPGAPIADQVGRVSILFILINEFDQYTRRMTPSELLRFLNEQFTRIDDICAANKVTKIETVGEEYVAAVGVLPKDKEENERLGHGHLLERLFVAVSQIMMMQTEEMKFKMGIHSGSIVAGVIGTKLPRYRLFGDTINSAARMMQKGIPGQLQFGEETHSSLPEHLTQQVKYRGEVEMKGKGKVKAWTFEASEDSPALPANILRERSNKADTSSSASMVGRRKQRATICNLTSMDDAPASLVVQQESQFEECLQQMKKAEIAKSNKRWLLSETEGFTPELERKFVKWFHSTVICKKLVRRFGMEAILVLVLSGFELWYMMDVDGNALKHNWDHPFYSGVKRLPIFVYSRGLILLMATGLWYFTEASSWIQKNPAKSQTMILVNCCLAIIFIYVSYDALVFSNTEEYRKAKQDKTYSAPEDQVYALNFVLFMFLYMRHHALLFFPSLVLLPVAITITMAPNFYNWFIHFYPPESMRFTAIKYKESIFTVQGEIIFIMQAVINIIVAHEDEQSSRARFKLRQRVQETQTRTQGVLDTLMPPLVLQALRELPANAPNPTDQYRHAMIAQSDLCGFTQLSANRKPTEVVKFMGDLFGAFDLLTDKHGVYKVETIGDAYIAGMAERPLTKTNSPYRVVLFALDMVRAVDEWAASMNVNVACRVGVAYGECIGGIVGTDMLRYHLFGDLLTIMDTLEATSVEGRVQISTPCKQEVERQLREEPGEMWPEHLTFRQREDVHLKTSKGEVHEYSEVGGPTFLVDSNKPLRNKKPKGTQGGVANIVNAAASKSASAGDP